MLYIQPQAIPATESDRAREKQRETERDGDRNRETGAQLGPFSFASGEIAGQFVDETRVYQLNRAITRASAVFMIAKQAVEASEPKWHFKINLCVITNAIFQSMI